MHILVNIVFSQWEIGYASILSFYLLIVSSINNDNNSCKINVWNYKVNFWKHCNDSLRDETLNCISKCVWMYLYELQYCGFISVEYLINPTASHSSTYTYIPNLFGSIHTLNEYLLKLFAFFNLTKESVIYTLHVDFHRGSVAIRNDPGTHYIHIQKQTHTCSMFTLINLLSLKV